MEPDLNLTHVSRFQGAFKTESTSRAEDLATLRALEKQRDVEPDWSVNAYMRIESNENRRRSVLTNFVVRMLGLGICADTEVCPPCSLQASQSLIWLFCTNFVFRMLGLGICTETEVWAPVQLASDQSPM